MNARNFKILIILLTLIFLAAASARAAAENKYDVKNLRSTKNAANYIAIAPKEFHDALKSLLEKREADGLRVALVSPRQIYEEFNRPPAGPLALRAFINYAWHNWQQPSVKYLLLVGDINIYEKFDSDAPVIPTFLVKVDVMGEAYSPSDAPFADIDSDNIPDIAYGRIPADDEDEVSIIVEKILNYENNPEPGPWRRRVSAFASTGDFGIFDSTLEEITKRVTRNNFDPAFDMNMTYAGAKLPYFALPDDFNPKVLNRFNEGSLLLSYIGHGREEGLTHVCWRGQCRKIFEMEDIANVNATGRNPFFFSVCCLTGKFDLEKDSFAEELLKSPAGPVGVFAAGEVSGPYPNAILSKDMLYFFVAKRPETVGEGLLNLRKGLVRRMDDDRKFLDRQYTLISSKEEMEKSNYDHIFMYNYFGDPATRIAYADESLEISAPENIKAGDTFDVSIKAPGGPAKLLVTLECHPTQVIHPIKPIEGLTGEELETAVAANYENANNKVAVKIETNLEADGSAKVTLTAPKDLPTETYYVKAYAWNGIPDAMGKKEISLTNPAPAPEEAPEKEEPAPEKPIDVITKLLRKSKAPEVKAFERPSGGYSSEYIAPPAKHGAKELEESLVLNPGSAGARIALAEIYFAENRYNEAVGLLKQASIMTPSEDEFLRMATLYRNLNLYEDALKALRKIPGMKNALKSSHHRHGKKVRDHEDEERPHREGKKKGKEKKSDGKDVKKEEVQKPPLAAYELGANILRKTNASDEAFENICLAMSGAYADHVESLFELLVIYMNRKDFDSALEIMDKLATKKNLKSYMKSYMVRVYSYLRHEDKGIAAASTITKNGDPEGYWWLAKLYMDKETPDVEAAFNAAWSFFLAKGHKYPKAAAVASFIKLLEIQRSDSAREYLDLALKISPDCLDCALMDWEKLRPATATDYCEKAAVIEPENSTPLFCLGSSAAADGDYEKAAGYFRKYRALASGAPTREEVKALNESGAVKEAVALISSCSTDSAGSYESAAENVLEKKLSLYFEIDQFDAALETYYEFTDQNQSSFFAHHVMAKTAADFKKHDLAASLEKKALAINPFCLDCYMQLGEYSENAGQYADAKSAYSTAIKIAGKNPNMKARLGRVTWKLGDDEEARNILLDVLSEAPGNSIAENTLIEMVSSDFFYR